MLRFLPWVNGGAWSADKLALDAVHGPRPRRLVAWEPAEGGRRRRASSHKRGGVTLCIAIAIATGAPAEFPKRSRSFR